MSFGARNVVSILTKILGTWLNFSHTYQVEQLGDVSKGRVQLLQGQTVGVSNMTVICYWSAVLLANNMALSCDCLMQDSKTHCTYTCNEVFFQDSQPDGSKCNFI